MIATEHLIQQLASEPTARRIAPSLRLTAGITCGALVALAVLALLFGWPLAAVPYTGVPAFAMKLAFALSMAALPAALLFSTARPGRRVGKRVLWLFLPPGIVFGVAVIEQSMIAPQFRQEAWLGSTFTTCLLAITLLSLPILAGVAWAFRRLAPTNLELSGFLAGITSGGAAAVVYALYCPETTATFLASWYTLGILAVGLVGYAAGPRLLKW
jgi:hypothetical protein